MPGRSIVAAVVAGSFVVVLSAGCNKSHPDNTCTGTSCAADLALAPADQASAQDFAAASPDLAMLPDLTPAPDLVSPADLMPPGGDAGLAMACATPGAISFMNGHATVMGDTGGAGNNTTASCGGFTGNDVVYSFTLANAEELVAKLTPGDPNFDAVISLRRACASAAAADELGCVQIAPGSTLQLDVVLAPGTYYLWVDGYSGTHGPFMIDLTLTAPPAAPPNDVCATAAALAFDMGEAGHAVAMVDLRGATDDALASCGGHGPDAVYTFTTTMLHSLLATATADVTSPGYTPVIYVRKACASAAMADELACTSGIAGGSASVHVASLPPGTYFIWVDSEGPGGKVALDVRVGAPPPANDTCMMPAPLTFVNGATSTPVDTTNATDDTSSFNCGGSGPDIVFTFTTTMAQQATITVTPPAGSMWQPVVYLRSACADTTQGAELGCEQGNTGLPATAIINTLPAGTYFVWVDGYAGSSGTGTLGIKLGAPVPPPTNDTCAMPAPLTFVNGVASAMVDTTAAKNDTSSPGCGGTTGPDLVWTFTTTMAQMVTATITPDMNSQSWDAIVYMRAMCGDVTAMGELACGEVGAGKAASASVVNLAAGTYFVWVDGYIGSKGRGTLTVTLAPPLKAPSNDNCTMPAPITLGQTLMGDTRSAMADLGSKLSMVCDPTAAGSFPGRDVVYAYAAGATGMVKISLTTDGSWDAALWTMAGMCIADGSSCTVSSDTAGRTGTETIQLAATKGTTYYIVVDSSIANAAGPFTLSIM